MYIFRVPTIKQGKIVNAVHEADVQRLAPQNCRGITLTESTGVVVSHSLGVSEGLQHRVALKQNILHTLCRGISGEILGPNAFFLAFTANKTRGRGSQC